MFVVKIIHRFCIVVKIIHRFVDVNNDLRRRDVGNLSRSITEMAESTPKRRGPKSFLTDRERHERNDNMIGIMQRRGFI